MNEVFTMKIRGRFFALILTLAALLNMTAVVSATQEEAADGCIQQIMNYYRYHETAAMTDIECLLYKLEETHPYRAQDWSSIMDYWRYVNEDMTLYPDVLPDGLPNDDTLCIVVMGYALNSDGKSYSVTGIGTWPDSDVVIPDTYNGVEVTQIGNSAFSGCTRITKITVPSYFKISSSRVSLLVMSIWFVGSSNTSTLGLLLKILHNASLTFSPPDNISTRLNTSSPVNRKAANSFLTSVCVKEENSSQ